MNILGDFHFIRPAWLLLAPVAAWIWWLTRRSQDPLRGWRSVIAPPLLEALTVGKNTRRRWRGAGLLVAWLLAVLAVAGPTWRPEPSPFADDPVPEGELQTGDVVVRTVTRNAEGTTAMMLPPVPADAPEGVRVYFGPPFVLDKMERGDATAQRTDTVKYQ
jgi:hypothetical protein